MGISCRSTLLAKAVLGYGSIHRGREGYQSSHWTNRFLGFVNCASLSSAMPLECLGELSTWRALHKLPTGAIPVSLYQGLAQSSSSMFTEEVKHRGPVVSRAQVRHWQAWYKGQAPFGYSGFWYLVSADPRGARVWGPEDTGTHGQKHSPSSLR